MTVPRITINDNTHDKSLSVTSVSKTPPALPPRNPTTSVFAVTSDLTQFSSQEGRIPAAWLVALTRHKGDEPHVHSFWLSHLFDNDASTVFLCKQCHYWFTITVTRPKDQPPESSTGICPVNQENSFHHLHTTTEIVSSISAHCCQCDFTVNVNITDPSIPMEIMNDLLRNRRLPYTYDSPSITNGTETTTELRDTVLALGKYLSELLSGNGKGIRITDEEFGFDGVSQAFFQIMDFHMGEDGYYEPPLLDNQGRIDSVKRVQEELYMMVLDNSGYINETIPKYEDPYTKLANIIGTQQPLFTIPSALDPSRISLRSTGYAVLGCVEDVQDEVIEWAYKRAIDHAPGHTLSYLEALRLIAGERNSDKLCVLFAMEQSSGKICLSDLKEACRELNLSEETVSDHEAVAAYKSLARAYPENRSSYRKHLSTIGKALNSRLLSDEDYSGYHMMDIVSDMPVGLDNIGNTCYLNSLLQYYFTIHDLRKAVIAFDMDSEINETDWKDKIIGGRKVFKSEVERARRFVSLLRDLFGNLIHTTQKSIAPDVQLAALALENAKAEEEETVRSMMNEVITFTDDNAHTGAVNTGENDPSNDVSNGTSNDNFLNSSETKMEFSESSTSEMMDTDINAGLPAFGESRPSYERCSAAHMMKKAAGLRSSYGTDYTASNTFTSRNNYNGKGKNKESHDGPDLEGTFMTSAEPIREEKPRTASSMLFGRQQDVAECMDNVMFQLEAAITPTILPSGEYINVVKNLFYGKTQQILRYKDKTTGNMVQAMKEEPFNQLFVVVTEGRDLYGGLDGYFDVSMVDYKGSQAEREVTISELPPILQIQLQRVQFDRSTANSYKSNAYMRFDKIVYLDRYLYSNREILQDRRKLATSWRQQLELLTEKVKELTERKFNGLSSVELLNHTTDFLNQHKGDIESILGEEVDVNISCISKEASKLRRDLSDAESLIGIQKDKLQSQFRDLRECAYRIHAVFVHSGQASFGHYWVYIYDFENERWLKYNDSYVSEVRESEVFADTTGSTANPYCMVYVRAKDAKEIVNTVCRRY